MYFQIHDSTINFPYLIFLQCGDFINLKILEITPDLASLGATLQEAEELQKAHNEVLRQLQVNRL